MLPNYIANLSYPPVFSINFEKPYTLLCCSVNKVILLLVCWIWSLLPLISQGIEIEVLPGATAFLPALIKSGFALHKFTFEGFLPQKKGRQTKLMEWSNYEDTLVFYESPHKLLKTLVALRDLCEPHRKVSVSREITKKFEETVNGTLTEVVSHFESKAPKGEFVVVLIQQFFGRLNDY